MNDHRDVGQGLLQFAWSICGLCGLTAAAALMVKRSLPGALLCSAVAGLFLVRAFLVMHDCSHSSLTPSRAANAIIGRICGLVALTPYVSWRRRHLLHHARSSNLDDRGWWDVPLLTVREYSQMPRPQRILYRLIRNPVVLIFIAPPAFFFFVQRVPPPGASRNERIEVHATSAIVLAGIVTLALSGQSEFIILCLVPMWLVASVVGFALFYLQHNSPEGWWSTSADWNFTSAALKGSVHLKLPRPLDWFTCYVGHHHIHHLAPRVPSYALPLTFESFDRVQGVPVSKLSSCLRAYRVHLWDEDHQTMVGWSRS